MSYVPPHKRNQPQGSEDQNQKQPPPSQNRSPGISPRTAAPGPRERDTSDKNAREREHRPRSNNYGTPKKVGSSRFGNIFDGDVGYSSYSGNNNRSQRNNSYSGNSSYGNSYGGYGRSRISRKAQAELSTQPNQHLERELFGEGAKMAQGINFDKYNDIPVEISGQDCPEGLDTFQASCLDEALINNINKCGYSVPTPVQKFSVPIVTQRRDLMACAQTGSGKTAAFLLPMIHNLLVNPAPDEVKSHSKSYPRALILSPTRELAQQIQKPSRKFLYCTSMRSVCVYGGAPIGNQFRDLQDGVHVLVATPGRLWDMMERCRMSLSCIEYLCLDEADRMLDMGFEPQIRNIVERSDMRDGENGRTTLMYSATFPIEIQQLAQDFLHDYIFLAVGRVGSTSDFITQKIMQVEKHEKDDTLFNLISECEGLKLVFTATKRDADRLEYQLREQGIGALAIHGDKGQRDREYALKQFKDSHVDILVATDVASRGLDIPNVMYVIQYDLPNTIDDYVHRIGRTGRCGNVGTAISFVNHHNAPVLSDLRELLKESDQDCPTWLNSLCSQCRGGKRKKKGRYGGRDYRNNKKSNYNQGNNSYGQGNRNSYGSGNNRRRNDDGW